MILTVGDLELAHPTAGQAGLEHELDRASRLGQGDIPKSIVDGFAFEGDAFLGRVV